MNLASYIDYTLLKPNAKQTDIAALCATAKEQHFAAVCVPPMYVSYSRNLLANTEVKICSVVGFPLGYGHWEGKMWETRWLISQGVEELDMVVNIAEVKNENWTFVKHEMARFVDICKEDGIISKLILEVTLLDNTEIQRLCTILNEIKPNFAKTSTGFTGISIWDEKEKVALMYETLVPEIAIKVAGGVRTKEQAVFFIENYQVKRIGTSALL